MIMFDLFRVGTNGWSSIMGHNIGGAGIRMTTSRGRSLGSLAQMATPTPEMHTGFTTCNNYDTDFFRGARSTNTIVQITSATNRYGVQIKPVFDGELDTIGDHSTMATIVEVNGRRLMNLQNVSVTLLNDAGVIRAVIRR